MIFKYGKCSQASKSEALRNASEFGHTKIVKLLLENGARNTHAISVASKRGYLKIVKLLIKNGANIRANKDEALRWAYSDYQTRIVKLLLKKGNYPKEVIKEYIEK
jgi:ankyrin repeat protein